MRRRAQALGEDLQKADPGVSDDRLVHRCGCHRARQRTINQPDDDLAAYRRTGRGGAWAGHTSRVGPHSTRAKGQRSPRPKDREGTFGPVGRDRCWGGWVSRVGVC